MSNNTIPEINKELINYLEDKSIENSSLLNAEDLELQNLQEVSSSMQINEDEKDLIYVKNEIPNDVKIVDFQHFKTKGSNYTPSKKTKKKKNKLANKSRKNNR